MRSHFLGLVLLTCFVGHGDLASAFLSRASQSACPTVSVECPADIDKSELVFRVKLSGGNVTEGLTFKWTVHGGEIKEGQGTSCVSITNFNLPQKTLTVAVEVGGLPEGCASTASCSISVRV
jgi:hypothetical protein